MFMGYVSLPEGKHKKLSNEKKGPWLFRVFRGWKTTQLTGDYNQPL